MFRSGARAAVALIGIALATASAQAGFERGLEKVLGKQARDAIESQYVVIAEGPAAEYVQRLGAALAEASPRHDLQYTFKVLDSEQVNAFALPWGYVYVTTGMLRFVDSSDQLAGVIGHEVAHVAEKHSIDAFKKQFWIGVLFGVVDAPATMLVAGNVGATLYLLRHSRVDEQAADKLGAGYAYLAGYDAAQLSDFLRKLDDESKREPSRIEIYLSTHPTGERRLARLAELPQVNGKDPQMLARTAQGFLDRHLANQAVVEYRKALELAPDDAAARAGLARAYGELGEADRAKEELARAGESAAQDLVQVEESPSSPPADALPIEAQQRDIKETAAAAAAWNLEMQDPARQLEERSKALEGDVRTLARRMNAAGTFGRPPFGGERVMEKADFALYLIAETTDQVAAVAKGLKSVFSGAVEVSGIVERDSAQLAGAADRGQWQALIRDLAAGVAAAGEQSPKVTAAALDAAKRAREAMGALASAVNALASEMDVLGGLHSGMPFLGLAESDADRALKMARDALEASRKAASALRGWRAQELSWQLSAAYLNTPPAQRPAARKMAAAILALAPEALQPQQGVGFGAVMAQAIAPQAPAQAPEASAQPPQAGKQGERAAERPQPPRGEELMLKLILADMKREAQARSRWQGADSPSAAPAS